MTTVPDPPITEGGPPESDQPLGGESHDVPDRCGTMEVHRRLVETVPGYAESRREIEEFAAAFLDYTGGAELRTGVVVIPVVVHIVYNRPEEEILDAQVHRQIQILNEDFGRTNPDASRVPARFRALAADTRIRFELAKRDPNCRATSGITRTRTNATTFSSATDNIKRAPDGTPAWDRDRYLNIWVAPGRLVSERGGNLLGYAQFPADPGPGRVAATDGVVIHYRCFGDTGTGTSNPRYDRGRTATHEVGHWLNALHIWGDDDDPRYPERWCDRSDNVADTPNQGGATENVCPDPETVRTSCNNEAQGGDMFMNYMDYTNDRCMFMFTRGQTARMQATLAGFRAPLLASPGLVQPVTSAPSDLWAQNTPADVGDEPDTTSPLMWLSDDIWVRPRNDGRLVQDHEEAQYRPAGFPPSYVYCRVRNRGCSAPGVGTVHLYWAKASTALSWPRPFDASVTVPALMGGPIGSLPTGMIPPGGYTVLEFPWRPPNPRDYASFGADRSHFCLLARIDDGTTLREGPDLYQNVRNHNNIVWKNITIAPEGQNREREGAVSVGNLDEQRTVAARLAVTAGRNGDRSLLDWASVTLHLGERLYDRWKRSGALGDGFEVGGNYDVVLVAERATLRGLVFEPMELDTLDVRVQPRDHSEETTEVFTLDVEQYLEPPDGGDDPLGGQRFVIKTTPKWDSGGSDDGPYVFDGVDWVERRA